MLLLGIRSRYEDIWYLAPVVFKHHRRVRSLGVIYPTMSVPKSCCWRWVGQGGSQLGRQGGGRGPYKEGRGKTNLFIWTSPTHPPPLPSQRTASVAKKTIVWQIRNQTLNRQLFFYSNWDAEYRDHHVHQMVSAALCFLIFSFAMTCVFLWFLWRIRNTRWYLPVA